MFQSLLFTKTFWTGVASIAAGAAFILAGDYAQGGQLIATGFIGIFLRDALVTYANSRR
jgi:septum formation inhibitor MinC